MFLAALARRSDDDSAAEESRMTVWPGGITRIVSKVEIEK
jgi:hypothetical protein